MDSSVTEHGKPNTNTINGEHLYNNVQIMESFRPQDQEGSRSTSSKSDVFYSGSPTRENQSQSTENFLQDEEDDELGYLGKLEDEFSAHEFMDSFNINSNESFCFWSY